MPPFVFGAIGFFPSDDASPSAWRNGARAAGISSSNVSVSPGLIDFCVCLVRPHGKVAVVGLCTALDHTDPFRAISISKEVSIPMSGFFACVG
jgi:hypothetical protein